jgi:2-polyprenyl-3-methyl-5-hydroxy-6-metoxy-1,4-benzoquinol methylase
MTIDACWCGTVELRDYSPEYRRCGACGTLVTRHGPAQDLARIRDDAQDFYGRDYWFGHQADDLGHPTIVERARTDLTERCIFWLHALLTHRLPPGRILELGAAHGGFVFLLRQVGFEATGQELSPGIVELARSTFDVPMLQGPVEDQDIAPQSLDVIALFDVMEHFQDPVGTLRHCLTLLKPEGFLLIQTPRVPPNSDYADLVARNDPFLIQFKKDEHLYLFSEAGVRSFFERLGAPAVTFMPAIFSHYDMFFTAARREPATYSDGEIFAALAKNNRLATALLDLYAHVSVIDRDREARLQVINALDARVRVLEGSEADPAAAMRALARTLKRWLRTSLGRAS